jgi:hypothetical protein
MQGEQEEVNDYGIKVSITADAYLKFAEGFR